MQAYLQRIHRYNPVYNAIVSMADDDVLVRQAELADEALAKGEYWGWMHGMPHAVKDLSNAEGFPTSRGSPIYAGTMAGQDSFMIGRIRRQGAIFIGKTMCPNSVWVRSRTIRYSVSQAVHMIRLLRLVVAAVVLRVASQLTCCRWPTAAI